MRTKKPPVPHEREIQAIGIKTLKSMGFTVHRRNVGAMKIGERFIRFSEAGQSDTWGTCPDGRRFECEFKRPGKVPTDKQTAWLRGQNNEHCVCFWVDNTVILAHIARHIVAGWRTEFAEGHDFDLVEAR